MKKFILLAVCIFMLYGCASMTYVQKPDGTTEVTYYRLFTGSDNIKGKLNNGASIEAQGQKTIDPATLQAIFDILGRVK